jgi:cell division transport system ATP-binding protein
VLKVASAAIEIRGVEKDYRGLRPLRLRELVVARGEMTALTGLDATEAAVLVDLVTGAVLPDAGEILVNGTSTASLASQDDWLRFLDQFGLVNPRVVLLDHLSVAQNLAVPLTLSVDPLQPDARARVESLAGDVRLDPALLDAPVSSVGPADRLRIRMGRAMALAPRVVLVEHPTLDLDRRQANDVARDLARLVGPDRALLALTGDETIARAAGRSLGWQPRTGLVEEAGGRRPWWRG